MTLKKAGSGSIVGGYTHTEGRGRPAELPRCEGDSAVPSAHPASAAGTAGT